MKIFAIITMIIMTCMPSFLSAKEDVSGLTPLVIMHVKDSPVYYERSLQRAVTAAKEIKPDAKFTVQAAFPRGAGMLPARTPTVLTTLMKQVAQSLHYYGVSKDDISFQNAPQRYAAGKRLEIFVK